MAEDTGRNEDIRPEGPGEENPIDSFLFKSFL